MNDDKPEGFYNPQIKQFSREEIDELTAIDQDCREIVYTAIELRSIVFVAWIVAGIFLLFGNQRGFFMLLGFSILLWIIANCMVVYAGMKLAKAVRKLMEK